MSTIYNPTYFADIPRLESVGRVAGVYTHPGTSIYVVAITLENCEALELCLIENSTRFPPFDKEERVKIWGGKRHNTQSIVVSLDHADRCAITHAVLSEEYED